MPLAPGTCLGTYEIVAALGAGGMGEVYRAKDLRLGREVALKVLPCEVASHADRLARFEREARVVAGLNHPNIVTLFSVEDEDGVHFLTMELVEGRSLDRLIPPDGMLLADLLEVAIPLADALSAAHEKGVVHRDLKPANVMRTRDGHVKVLDFGLAKPLQAVEEPARTHTGPATAPITVAGQLLGTVPYMAPEQVRGEAADPRSDLFALGVVLYEMAAGRRPFTGETYVDVGFAILRTTPEPLSRVRRDVPADLERIVSRCLEKEPGDRAQSARDVGDALRRARLIIERGETASRPPAQVPSIAVLPFVNRSRDDADEYFSDGLADELLNVLARVPGLRVIARASSFRFRSGSEDVETIGRKLNVATLLDGSVRKAGDRVRISVQLIRVSDSTHLWSETFDRRLDDIFAVQDEIARSVVKSLRATLLGESADSALSRTANLDVARAARGRAADPEAHRLFLVARHLMTRYTREDLARGIDYLHQALARDPDFAIAWAELARAYARQADHGWIAAAGGYGRAREAAERALELEPDLVEGHLRLSWIRMTYERDWKGAEAAVARALEIAPGNVQALGQAGVVAGNLGRFEEAIGRYRQVLEQDPLSSATCHNLGMALQAADRLAEAESAFRKALELAPQRVGTRAMLALALLAQERGAEALAEAAREPEERHRLWALTIVHAVLGRQAESDAALEVMVTKHADTMAYQIAELHAARGDVDAAFEWLERAYAQQDGGLADMKRSPNLRALHADSRWAAFLKRMGFEG